MRLMTSVETPSKSSVAMSLDSPSSRKIAIALATPSTNSCGWRSPQKLNTAGGIAEKVASSRGGEATRFPGE
jgi:hypothetical protein